MHMRILVPNYMHAKVYVNVHVNVRCADMHMHEHVNVNVTECASAHVDTNVDTNGHELAHVNELAMAHVNMRVNERTNSHAHVLLLVRLKLPRYVAILETLVQMCIALQHCLLMYTTAHNNYFSGISTIDP